MRKLILGLLLPSVLFVLTSRIISQGTVTLSGKHGEKLKLFGYEALSVGLMPALFGVSLFCLFFLSQHPSCAKPARVTSIAALSLLGTLVVLTSFAILKRIL